MHSIKESWDESDYSQTEKSKRMHEDRSCIGTLTQLSFYLVQLAKANRSWNKSCHRV